MRYLFLIFLSCFFSITCFAGDVCSKTSKAVLTVEVMNGTANGSTVTGDEVNVRVYRHEELLNSLDAKAGTDGKAVFENVPAGEHIMVVASVKHQEMMFKGHPVALRPTESSIFTKVQVFDVSEDQSSLSVSAHHMILKPFSNTLKITEYMQLVNSSDKAVTSEKRDASDRPIVLKISLPKGFGSLESSSYFEDDALIVTEEGFYDTLAVPPGEYPITFSYTLEITSGIIDVVKKISLPTSSLVIFSELGSAKLTGLGKADNRALRADGTTVDYYKRSGLDSGEQISFRITGFNVNTIKPYTWIILAVVFGAVLVLAILRLRPEKG